MDFVIGIVEVILCRLGVLRLFQLASETNTHKWISAPPFHLKEKKNVKCALLGTAACSFMHVKCQHEKLELVEFMPMKLLIENGEKKVEQWSHCVYQFLEHVQGTQYQQKKTIT